MREFEPKKENEKNPEHFASQIKAISAQLEKLYFGIEKLRKEGDGVGGDFLRIIFDTLFKSGGEHRLAARNRSEAEEAVASHTELAEKFSELGIVSRFSIEESANGEVFVVVKVSIEERIKPENN